MLRTYSTFHLSSSSAAKIKGNERATIEMLVVKTGSFILSPVAGHAVLTPHLVKVGHGDEEDEGDEEGDGISCCKFGISFFPMPAPLLYTKNQYG